MSPTTTREQRAMERYCVLIPAYREGKRIGDVVHEALKYLKDVIVIDDGSDDDTVQAAEAAGAVVLRHEKNKGKGMALNTGFQYARERGFAAVITLDGDGQHPPEHIPRFIEAYVRTGIPVLIGNRMGDLADMPVMRKLTNRFMSWLLSRQMGVYVPDTQCGYRLYRCDLIPLVFTQSPRFAAESEILLRIADHGVVMDAVPIRTVYRDEKSKIHPVRDTVRFLSMLWQYRRRKKRTII